jgi:hypothetical protein
MEEIMTRVITVAVFAFMLTSWPACASAQDNATPPGNAPTDASDAPAHQPGADASRQRFRFSKTGDGILRLDSETGQVSFCSAREVGWACQVAPDDRVALDNEIARLQSQIETLNKEVTSLHANESAAPPRPPEPVPPTKNGELKFPSRADLERAKAFLDDAWRRLVDMLEQWRKDMRRT